MVPFFFPVFFLNPFFFVAFFFAPKSGRASKPEKPPTGVKNEEAESPDSTLIRSALHPKPRPLGVFPFLKVVPNPFPPPQKGGKNIPPLMAGVVVKDGVCEKVGTLEEVGTGENDGILEEVGTGEKEGI